MSEVKSAKRVVEVIDLLSRSDSSMTVTQVAKALGFPQSSTSNLLQTLVTLQVLHFDILNSTYSLGTRINSWTNVAKSSMIQRIRRQMIPYMTKIRDQINETSFLVLYEGTEVLYIDKKESRQSIRTTATIGETKPMYITGVGKAILYTMPLEIQSAIIEQTDLKKVTPKTITDKEELLDKLSQYQKQGYAVDDEESELGLLCYAVPLFNEKNEAIAAVSVAGLKGRIQTKSDQAVKILKEISQRVIIKE